MNDLLAYFTLRTFLVFSSTAFSLLFVMLVTNIITIDDVISIFNLSNDSANALRTVIARVQEVTGNLIDVISQLLNKLFGWAGVDIDLHKIKVDPNHVSGTSGSAAGSSTSLEK